MNYVERIIGPLIIRVEGSFHASMRFWSQWRRNGRPSTTIINRQVRSGLYEVRTAVMEEINE